MRENLSKGPCSWEKEKHRRKIMTILTPGLEVMMPESSFGVFENNFVRILNCDKKSIINSNCTFSHQNLQLWFVMSGFEILIDWTF